MTTARGRVVHETVPGERLAGNPLGDPTQRRVPIYLPPGYDADGERRYPTIYKLAGFTGHGRMLLNEKAWAEALDARMDRLIASGRADPAIVVMPDCFTRIGGSQYVDSPAIGDYESYLCDELVPFIDARYRTVASREGRGVAGKSSGGYGAMSLGMRRPDVFAAIASHSGDMYFEYGYLPDMPKLWKGLHEHGGPDRTARAFLEWFERRPKKSSAAIGAINMIAMAAAYSPNPANAADLGVDLPIDRETGELRLDVWKRWLERDPVRMVEQADYADALRSMRTVFIDCGTRDEFHLHLGARIMAGKLAAKGIEHVHEEYEDGHFDILYRYDESLSRLSKALASGPGS